LPVALTGTVDMRYREKAKDYAFMFSTIVWNLEFLFGYIYERNSLLVDYAGAITNGFIIGLGYAPEFRIIFWTHCLRKFEEYSKVITDKVKFKIKKNINENPFKPNFLSNAYKRIKTTVFSTPGKILMLNNKIFLIIKFGLHN
jgi:hypothetical protein